MAKKPAATRRIRPCADADGLPRVSRRQLLTVTGAGLMSLPLSLAPTLALAAPNTDKRLVVIILRGGLDGLGAIVPYGDRTYREARGGLAFSDPARGDTGLWELDGTFAANPGLAPLQPYWQAKQLAVLHAVALPYRQRSHFDAQNILENGTDRPSGAPDGWLNRALSLYGANGQQLGLAVGNTPPLILTGRAQVATWSPRGGESQDSLINQMQRIYRHDPLFSTALTQAVRTQAMAEMALSDVQDSVNRARRVSGPNGLAQMAVPVSRLLLQEGGARVAVVEMGGWDTHANQGTSNGALANNLRGLANGMASFAQELQPVWDKSAILVMTEFGRTVAMNGTGGSDHGTGGMALVMGGAVRGGEVFADWPGLGASDLYQGRDLAPTMDMRAPIKSILTELLDIPLSDVNRHVLPGSSNISPVKYMMA